MNKAKIDQALTEAAVARPVLPPVLNASESHGLKTF
jgi:hypothetical protein